MVDVAMANMFGFPVGSFRWDERYGMLAAALTAAEIQLFLEA